MREVKHNYPVPNTITQSFLKKCRPTRRQAWAVLPMVLAVLALGAVGLAWAGRNLPPPQFTLNHQHLLTPIDYPSWRRTSDWLARRKYIMLSFDDGPGAPGVDTKILATLARHHAHAVFFEVCTHITPATRAVPQRILASGNLLGNHSYDHPHLPTLGPTQLRHEIAGCSATLAAITGARPSLFRPPWGQLSPAVARAIRAAGMQIVLWDANSGDTWLKPPQQIVHMSLYEASLGGHILLMHSYATTADALDALLTKLQKRGFRFVLPSISANRADMR